MRGFMNVYWVTAYFRDDNEIAYYEDRECTIKLYDSSGEGAGFFPQIIVLKKT